ncbi:GLPGLI family protein [Sphingobacterium spiritivorum]|uniref:GLPGLI family protein n=1 Tax=Sphingobacterium TaxID=28453 RepID=UPI00191819AE|nr:MULTISPECIES: GLPGLI family protein [Sphingobacterium]QQT24281.1 GLPGLI family protein [Sphingobacterium spiritivorum]
MKIVKIFLFISIALSARSGFAQYTMFPKTGTITYDKTVYLQNMLKKQLYAKAEGMTKNWYDQISNKLPGNVVLKNTLKFNNDETLFEYVKTDINELASSFMENHAIKGDGTVYTNLKTKEYKRYQDFFGDNLVIKDSVLRIKWKITDEYRDIAGFECRRANGLTQDSLYVIGYYTNEIPVSGGPESISGLPGMILGLVVPYDHVSYFASKVEFSNTVPFDLSVFDKKKNKVMPRKEVEIRFRQMVETFLPKDLVTYLIDYFLL